jgi:hypothetical protein
MEHVFFNQTKDCKLFDKSNSLSQYEPSSRPTFAEAVEKLAVLLDKINNDLKHAHANPIISTTTTTSTTSTTNNKTNPCVYISSNSSSNNSNKNNNNNNNNNNNKINNNNNNVIFQNKNSTSNNISSSNNSSSNNKRNSIDSTMMIPQSDTTKLLTNVNATATTTTGCTITTTTTTSSPKAALGTDRDNENHDAKVKLREKSKENLHAPLQHRRSLSENIIQFPLHTTPSDKARCHMLNRTNSKSQMTDDTIGDDETTTTVSNLVALRKVAETMVLKDPQSRNVKKSKSSKPTNPFTALAQLRGVKKILGANPSTYTAGVGDLFSSCFEMSTPFLKELSKQNRRENGEIQPKSLPSSPSSLRKDYNPCVKPIDEKTDLLKDVTVAVPVTVANGECGCEEWQHRGNFRQPQFCGTLRKYKANFNDLSSHPLYNNGKLETDETVLQPHTVGDEGEVTLGDAQSNSKISKLIEFFGVCPLQ